MSGSRVGDEPLHPAIIQVQTEQQLLNQRLESSLSAFAGHLSALQGDMQGVKAKLDTLAHAQSDFTHHSTAVDRLAKAIEKQSADSERRWLAHEAENKTVSDTVNSHRTGIKVSWALFGVIVVVLGAWGNARFAGVEKGSDAQALAAQQRMADHLASGAETKRAYEARFQRNEQDLRDLREDMKALKTP